MWCPTHGSVTPTSAGCPLCANSSILTMSPGPPVDTGAMWRAPLEEEIARLRADLATPTPAQSLAEPAPVPLLLFCPACSAQHVDAPQPEKGWSNPPHRSHECQACGHVWRPADVATTGVAAIGSRGTRDRSAVPVSHAEYAARAFEVSADDLGERDYVDAEGLRSRAAALRAEGKCARCGSCVLCWSGIHCPWCWTNNRTDGGGR